jgi:thymidylate synthase (FAD)
MIKRIPQAVDLLPSLPEKDMLQMFAHITAAPYGNGLYDMEKTHKIIESCVRRGHLSILEHGNISLRIVTNIGTYKDYTRHRHCAFTIESTSFTKYGDVLEVITTLPISEQEEQALENLQKAYRGISNIKIARDYLPQCCAATMVMTTNIREWRHIIGTRGDPNDNPLTRELRRLIWIRLNKSYPFFFPFSGENPNMTIYNTYGNMVEARLNPEL